MRQRDSLQLVVRRASSVAVHSPHSSCEQLVKHLSSQSSRIKQQRTSYSSTTLLSLVARNGARLPLLHLRQTRSAFQLLHAVYEFPSHPAGESGRSRKRCEVEDGEDEGKGVWARYETAV